MRLLYLDDSGTPGDREQQHFILAGICLYEGQAYWLSEALEKVVAGTDGLPRDPREIELHANPLLRGKNAWKRVQKADRRRVMRHGLAAIRELKGDPPALFGAVLDKRQLPAREEPAEYAFEQLCNRFDRYLQRRAQADDKQRGLMILDRSAMENTLQNLTRRFRHDGHRWGRATNLADVPLFVDSAATRVIQYADLVAHALWRHFEHNDSEFFDVIRRDFDADEEGRVHGLLHFRNRDVDCDCPSCMAR
ncbi:MULTISPECIES: DUF3800 domain-containing protein [unclassified Halorhodospira]|uniref:DUF3800 domain-containing protein n=1 Tax=unclassified Halorhodospira TaxID=2626748 RepID=UPI001EE87ECA|nr:MULTISPECIES: DUF3800 domain-containing protein [unclassified Halorhodospira]MCG5542049.1 DUF3800 domain-containing protein [Halorhodospira sp. M39old]MCG5547099.1 DUF3800 domain-containing protein [Halorhodospira sp. M38]